jgi:hypothetical protein
LYSLKACKTIDYFEWVVRQLSNQPSQQIKRAEQVVKADSVVETKVMLRREEAKTVAKR